MYDLVVVGGKHFTLISDIGHYFTGSELKPPDNISAGTDDSGPDIYI